MNCSSLGSVIVVLEETFTGFIPPSQTVIISLFLVRHLTHFQQFQESPRGQSWALHCFCFASVIFQIQLQNKKITMFAEDTELFKEIKSSNDTQLSKRIQPTQNPGSSHLMPHLRRASVTLTKSHMKQSLPSMFTTRMVSSWSQSMYLSELQSFGFFKLHSCANKGLTQARRSLTSTKSSSTRYQIYLALIRLHLGYATLIWGPQLVQLILKLERIQRYACFKIYALFTILFFKYLHFMIVVSSITTTQQPAKVVRYNTIF